MAFEFTADDVASGIVVSEKCSVVAQVTDFEEKPGSKDPNSVVSHIYMKVVESENPDYIGMPLRAFFSEKFPAAALPFLRAVGYVPPREGGSVDFGVFVQRKAKLIVDVKPGTYNNAPANEIIGYRPLE